MNRRSVACASIVAVLAACETEPNEPFEPSDPDPTLVVVLDSASPAEVLERVTSFASILGNVPVGSAVPIPADGGTALVVASDANGLPVLLLDPDLSPNPKIGVESTALAAVAQATPRLAPDEVRTHPAFDSLVARIALVVGNGGALTSDDLIRRFAARIRFDLRPTGSAETANSRASAANLSFVPGELRVGPLEIRDGAGMDIAVVNPTALPIRIDNLGTAASVVAEGQFSLTCVVLECPPGVLLGRDGPQVLRVWLDAGSQAAIAVELVSRTMSSVLGVLGLAAPPSAGALLGLSRELVDPTVAVGLASQTGWDAAWGFIMDSIILQPSFGAAVLGAAAVAGGVPTSVLLGLGWVSAIAQVASGTPFALDALSLWALDESAEFCQSSGVPAPCPCPIEGLPGDAGFHVVALVDACERVAPALDASWRHPIRLGLLGLGAALHDPTGANSDALARFRVDLSAAEGDPADLESLRQLLFWVFQVDQGPA